MLARFAVPLFCAGFALCMCRPQGAESASTPEPTGAISAAAPARAPDAGAPAATALDAATAAPPQAPGVVVLEHAPCRSDRSALRVALAANGSVSVATAGEPPQTGSVPAAEVDALVQALAAAGVERWGNLRCKQSEQSRCGMHPCVVTLKVRVGGVEHLASSDGSAAHAELARGIARVKRVAQTWRYLDSDLDPDAAGPCQSAHDCGLVQDSCGGLHAVLASKAKARAASGDCALAIFPKSGVEPSCVAGRCALLPVLGNARSCTRSAECSAVSHCGHYGAVRRDQLKKIALKNDHRACNAPSGPVPPVACLHGVCVTRGP